MDYLLDTNICIYLIKQKPPAVIERFRAVSPGAIGISALSMAELAYGAAKSQQPVRNAQALELFLLPLIIVEFDAQAAAIAGEIRAELELRGTPIGAYDVLIAAHALALNLTLVTNNQREFARVPGLTIENWAL